AKSTSDGIRQTRSWIHRNFIVCTPRFTLLMYSFDNDQFVALSVDSSFTKANDCYRISTSHEGKCILRRADQIVTTNQQPTNLAISVSHQHNAIAHLNS